VLGQVKAEGHPVSCLRLPEQEMLEEQQAQGWG